MNKCPSCNRSSENPIRACRCGWREGNSSTPLIRKVGYELQKVIDEGTLTSLVSFTVKLLKGGRCGCPELIGKMNDWGVEGCIERREEIATEIRKKLLYAPGAREHILNAIDLAIVRTKPPPRQDNGPWYVAITTAPRKVVTAEETFRQVRQAGWEPTVFAEPGSHWVSDFDYLFSPTKLGIWHNWVRSVKAALDSGKPYILTLQDES